ncbi:MAG: MFS transporter [Deltaproteobacteria bacterium]|nr:MFS transporter [Deltaproteobacteria bacterium]
MSIPSRTTADAALEAERVNPYLVFLFALLSTATLFDGFDAAMLGFAAPEVRETFGIGLDDWGFVAGATRLGVMASFLFLISADRLGRRTLMMVTVIGFTVFNGLTAFTTSTTQFVLCQFFARLFLTAEYALAVVMIGEEYPARLRGRAIAILTSLATVGVMLMAKVQPHFLLAEGESNAVHASVSAWVAAIQGAFGLDVDAAGWRSLYLVGAFPLVLILLLRLGMRETRRFEAAREASRQAAPGGGGLREQVGNALTPWSPAYRRQTAVVTLLWNCVYVVTGPSTVYWVIFARETIRLTPHQVGDIVFWGYAGGVAGHFVAGWLIDAVGRKLTCAGFYVAAAVSICMLFQDTSLAGQYVWMILTVFCFASAMTATHVYASELFPTEIRATGYGWTTNFLGRVTEVAIPMVIGLLIAPLGGMPAAMAVVAIGPVLGAVLVMRYAPETRGLTLEQVQEKLQAR